MSSDSPGPSRKLIALHFASVAAARGRSKGFALPARSWGGGGAGGLGSLYSSLHAHRPFGRFLSQRLVRSPQTLTVEARALRVGGCRCQPEETSHISKELLSKTLRLPGAVLFDVKVMHLPDPLPTRLRASAPRNHHPSNPPGGGQSRRVSLWSYARCSPWRPRVRRG